MIILGGPIVELSPFVSDFVKKITLKVFKISS
jgi:hypothetical protein